MKNEGMKNQHNLEPTNIGNKKHRSDQIASTSEVHATHSDTNGGESGFLTDQHIDWLDDTNRPPANQTAVNIYPGTDLNEIDKVSQEEMGQFAINNDFSSEVYNNLPIVLKDLCQLFDTPNDKGVFLVGALGVISSILPNIVGDYRRKKIESNLYAYILANYGVGKGTLEFAKKLIEPVHKQKREQYKKEMEEYREYKIVYEKAIKIYHSSKNNENDPPREPVLPPNRMHIVPINNSKTGVYVLLYDNNGRALLIDTEGDTLADQLKQDYGNFSDVLRKGFHHESISFYRRTNNEYADLERTYLSVVISSTFDQYQKLVPTIENGLYSRFIYFFLQSNRQFDDVFDKNTDNYEGLFNDWGQRLLTVYNVLDSLVEPIRFELQEHQEAIFLETFQKYKDEILEYVTPDMEGTANRLGIICFRICMILTALRFMDKLPFTKKIICTDQDFENALRIIEVLKAHSLSVFWKIQKRALAKVGQSMESDDMKKQMCLKLRSETDLSIREITTYIYGNDQKKSTVHRWLHGY